MSDPIAVATAFADAYPDLPTGPVPNLPLAWEENSYGQWHACHAGYRLVVQGGAGGRWNLWSPAMRLAAYGSSATPKRDAEAALLAVMVGGDAA